MPRALLARLGPTVGLTVAGAAALLLVGTDAPERAWPAVALAAGLGVAGLVAAWRASRDPLPGRTELLGWTRERPQVEEEPRTLLRAQGVSGELVDAVHRFDERLDEWLTRHRTARRRAEQVERYESEFLSTVSHELRTPLNSILGFSQVLLEEIDGPLTPGQREDVETIRASGHHLRELVDDVLDLAHIESGLFTLERRAVEVAPVIREAARLLEAQRRGRPVTIDTRVEDGVSTVDADPKRLRQIVMNLATNALKFTERGSVVLEATVADDRVRIAVRDTGPGIPRGEIAALFEEFTHARSALRKRQGAGLGLAICKRLVDLHGGRIEVDSAVGEGSTFALFLPPGRGE